MKNILPQSLSKNYLPEGRMVSSAHSFDNSDRDMLTITRQATQLIGHYTAPLELLAGKPIYSVGTELVTVHLFYYTPTEKALNHNTVNRLGSVLSELFGQSVELRLVKIHYPYMDRTILAQYIAMNAEVYPLSQIVRRLFRTVSPVTGKNVPSDLPSHIVGLKISVSGRLETERVRTRQGAQTMQVGTFSKSKLSLIDYASHTTVNSLGQYTVKVWLAQRRSLV